MSKIKRSKNKRKKHKKIIKISKGYFNMRSKSYKIAKQSSIKAKQYSYIDRKKKKRNLRKIWITKINFGLKKINYSYKIFINKLNKSKFIINRKILSYLYTKKNKIFYYIIKKIYNV